MNLGDSVRQAFKQFDSQCDINNKSMTMSTDLILEQWLAEESAVMKNLHNGRGPGVASPQEVMQLTGLQAMQGMLQGSLPYAGIGKTMDFHLIQVEEGKAIFQGAPSAAHLNPMGTVHGGWYATLLDSAMGCAVHTMMPVGRGYTTAELSLNLVRAITPKVTRLRAIGTVVHCGRQLATTEGRLVGPDGTLYAHATSTCLVFELKPKT
jgi:uncharacterized protein (TIGR00369 family)